MAFFQPKRHVSSHRAWLLSGGLRRSCCTLCINIHVPASDAWILKSVGGKTRGEGSPSIFWQRKLQIFGEMRMISCS